MSISSLMPFFFLLLSAVAFSFATLSARLFFTEKLSTIIDFQSTSVFIVFIIQMGLRTGIRLHYHHGFYRTVERVYNYLNIRSIRFAFVLTLISGVFYQKFFFSFCFAQAILSFNQGLFVARKEFSNVAKSSVLIFSHIVLSVACIFITESKQLTFILIESLSLGVLLISRVLFVQSSQQSLKATKLLIKKYFPLQLGALIVYAAMYLFAQCVIKFGKVEPQIVLAYADASIVAGVTLLLVGKGMVFLEGKIIKEKRFLSNLSLYLAFVVGIVVLYVVVVSYLMPYDSYWAAGSIIFLLGRFAFSYVSQFANVKSRNVLYGLGVGIIMILVMFNFLNVDYIYYKSGILFFNFISVVLIYLIIYRFNSERMFS